MQLHPNLELPFDIAVPGLGMLHNVQVEKMIGQGLFGPVWRIRDLEANRLFALEQVRIDENDPSQIDEFTSQINQTIKNQPASSFIPSTYGLVLLDEEEFGLIHEYVKGKNLKDWIALNLNDPWPQKRKLFAQLLDAVKAFLPNHFSFDAISLENITVLDSGDLRVNGLGSIHYLKRLANKPSFSNRICHEAPEYQLEEKSIVDQEKSAVFSLACVLFYLIRGHAYWEGFATSRPPYSKMFSKDTLTDSNILETFYPSFTHTAEEAILTLRSGSCFNPDKRNLSLDELIFHFGKAVEEQPKKKAEQPIVREAKKSPTPIEQEVPIPQKEVVEETSHTKTKNLSDLLNLPARWRILIFGFVLMSLASLFAWKLNQKIGQPAELQLKERTAWSKALKSKTEYFLKAYLSAYPDGYYQEDARKILETLPLPRFDLDWLTAKRFTGKIDRFDDKQVFSVRLSDLEDRNDRVFFKSEVNIGPQMKRLNGWIYRKDLRIRFEDDPADDKQFRISDGRLYFDGEEVFFESIDLSQYWILE